VVLVDSSVWILTPRKPSWRDLVGEDEIVTCLPVIEEVLRGAPSEQKYQAHLAQFEAVTILDSPLPYETFLDAVQIFRVGRVLGITIRSPYDCLIAACAIRNGAEVLHADRDFTHIARFTSLKQRNYSDLALPHE